MPDPAGSSGSVPHLEPFLGVPMQVLVYKGLSWI